MNKTILANIKVHSKLIKDGNYQLSPHKSYENKQKIKRVVRSIVKNRYIKHLDVGCGDGFIFSCVPKTWSSYGLDITDEMIKECKKNHPSVVLRKGLAENLPFPDSYFDFVTCYSFLDHLKDTSYFYNEVYKVLKPGGSFFFGLSPNSHFYNAIQLIEHYKNYNLARFNPELEFKKAFHNSEHYKSFGINKKDLELCEPGKSKSHGLDPYAEILKIEKIFMKKIKVEIKFNWVVNQNKLNKGFVKTIYNSAPFSSSFFKYFDIIGKK